MYHALLEVVGAAEPRIHTASRVSLFLDFDGTLAWVVSRPEAAKLEEPTRDTLSRIARKHWLVTTIISGRAVEDLYSRVRLTGLIYAGNHGLEIFGRQFRFVEPGAAARRDELRRIAEDLAGKLRSLPGVLVEYKGYTASIHYRQASEALLPEIERAVRAAVSVTSGYFRLNEGKKVFEIVPQTDWHKGAAVQWINRQLGDTGNVLSIYLGDDTTDEDAFRVLPDAITIKVGSSPETAARYRLPDPVAVHQFLEWLAESR